MSSKDVINEMDDEEFSNLINGIIKYVYGDIDLYNSSKYELLYDLKLNLYNDYIISNAIADGSVDFQVIFDRRERAESDKIALDELDTVLSRMNDNKKLKKDK